MFDKMKQLFELQSKMKVVKRELETSSVEVEEKNGQIKIVISGDQKIRSLEIADSLLDGQDKNNFSKDLVNCFNKAINKSQKLATDKMREVAGISIPGL